MLVTRNSSISAPSLCSAFAIADSIAFLISPAAFFCVNDKMFSALSTGLPRTRSATSLPFCADRRTPRTDAVVSIVVTLLLLRRHAGLFIGRVALERAGQRKLAQLVADHVLVDVNGDVLFSIVHSDCQADELRQDRRATRPRLDRFLIARRCGRFHLGHQVAVYKRALF